MIWLLNLGLEHAPLQAVTEAPSAPTSALQYSDIQSEVGFYLGWTRTSSNWTSDQSATINAVIASGERQFYVPPILPGERHIHEWSFLKPVMTITTVSGQGDYGLPHDFGGIEGCLTYNANQGYRELRIIGEGEIRKFRQRTATSGYPRFAAVRPYRAEGTTSQRYELMLWPEPDGAYDLTFKYNVLTDSMSSSRTYPFGEAVHGECLLESCLAVAEQRVNDQRGVHWEMFMQRLAASIFYDRQTNRQEFFGYNGDSSDDRRGRPGRGRVYGVLDSSVTYNGTLY